MWLSQELDLTSGYSEYFQFKTSFSRSKKTASTRVSDPALRLYQALHTGGKTIQNDHQSEDFPTSLRSRFAVPASRFQVEKSASGIVGRIS